MDGPEAPTGGHKLVDAVKARTGCLASRAGRTRGCHPQSRCLADPLASWDRRLTVPSAPNSRGALATCRRACRPNWLCFDARQCMRAANIGLMATPPGRLRAPTGANCFGVLTRASQGAWQAPPKPHATQRHLGPECLPFVWRCQELPFRPNKHWHLAGAAGAVATRPPSDGKAARQASIATSSQGLRGAGGLPRRADYGNAMRAATASPDLPPAVALAAASEDSQFVEQMANTLAMLADDMATQAGALAVLEAERKDSAAELGRTQRALANARQELHVSRVREAMAEAENKSLRRELELAKAAIASEEAARLTRSAPRQARAAASFRRPGPGASRGSARPMSAAAGLRLRASAVKLPPVGAGGESGKRHDDGPGRLSTPLGRAATLERRG